MYVASILVIYQSINTIVSNAQYFTETNTTKTLSDIDISAFPISFMIITAITKSILSRGVPSVQRLGGRFLENHT